MGSVYNDIDDIHQSQSSCLHAPLCIAGRTALSCALDTKLSEKRSHTCLPNLVFHIKTYKLAYFESRMSHIKRAYFSPYGMDL